MRPAADVLKFPLIGPLRPAKARLRPDTQAGVKRLIALAPVLGQRNPRSVPAVERVMLNLIGAPPDGGLEQDEPDTHARAVPSVLPRRDKAAHGIRNVERSNELLTAIVTEAWDALVNLKLNARR